MHSIVYAIIFTRKGLERFDCSETTAADSSDFPLLPWKLMSSYVPSPSQGGHNRCNQKRALRDPIYVDISLAPNRRKRVKIETTRNAFAYVFAGQSGSSMHRIRARFRADPLSTQTPTRSTTRGITRLCSSIPATKLLFEAVKKASDFCWYPASPIQERSYTKADPKRPAGRWPARNNNLTVAD
jgi:hypothetical protein